MRTALIVGGTGVVGWALRERLEETQGWRVLSLSRRAPPGIAADTFVGVDLFDRDALADARDKLRDVTHVFITLRVPANTPEEEVRNNVLPLENLMSALAVAGAPLERVCLIHGTKWYGCHQGPFATPAKEHHPRKSFEHYYYAQHDLITRLQQGQAWSWVSLRPHTVWGRSQGTGNSIVAALGVYATLLKAHGRPLDFPGPVDTWSKLSQGVTAELLARAMEWAAVSSQCANQDFNITNGDSFRWQYLWPEIAKFFDMPAGEVVPQALSQTMADEGKTWSAIAKKNTLREADLERLVSWPYLDSLLQPTWDDLSSVIKARQFGFEPSADSETAFLACLENLRRDHVIP